VNKLARLNLVVPWFKAGKVFFPEELKHSRIMAECMLELGLATMDGLKGKDDFLDTISMLGYLKPWKPSDSLPEGSSSNSSSPGGGIFDDEPADQEQASRLASYIA
jgi:hypothetical protein